jgi:gamma-glutamylcyclotransferase (GGCT)/AIG2-like uncharacterized protein YtfP
MPDSRYFPTPASQCAHLFVYGTLQPQFAPEEVAPLVGSLQVAGQGSVRGVLYNLGRYPGAVLASDTSRRIHGTVLVLPEGIDLLAELDAYEEHDPDTPVADSLFTRRICKVCLADSTSLSCWIYEYNGPVKDKPIIADGIFKP